MVKIKIKSLFLLIVSGLILILSFFAFRVYQQRVIEMKKVEDQSSEGGEQGQKNNQEGKNESNEGNSGKEGGENSEIEKKANHYLEKQDCENECVRFKTAEAKLYCQQVCGLVPVNTGSERDCENLTSPQNEYCWRDKAISERNFELCKKIKDKNLFQQCKNRILEDIVDNSN